MSERGESQDNPQQAQPDGWAPRDQPPMRASDVAAQFKLPLTPEQLRRRADLERFETAIRKLVGRRYLEPKMQLQVGEYDYVEADASVGSLVEALKSDTPQVQIGVLANDHDEQPAGVALPLDIYLALMRPHLENGSIRNITIQGGPDAHL